MLKSLLSSLSHNYHSISDSINHDEDSSQIEHVLLNDCFESIGNGRYQQRLALLLGFCNTAMAAALGAFTFLVIEMHDVSDAQKGWLGASLFIGMLVGSLFWGILSDHWGRYPSLIVSLTVTTCFLAAMAGSPNFTYSLIFEVLCGFGLAGITALVFGLLTEFLALEKRGVYLNAIAWFWMVGSVYAAGMAWIILGVVQLSWRIFTLISAAMPLLACLLVALFAQESPRHLFVLGFRRKSLQVLENIAAINGQTLVLERYLLGIPRTIWNDVPPPSQACCTALCQSFSAVGALFAPEFRATTLLLSLLFFTLSYAWYGLMLFLPLILDHLDLNLNVYSATLLVISGNLPGNLLLTLIIDRFHRKTLLAGSLACCFIVTFAFSFTNLVESAAFGITMAIFFSFFGTITWNVLACTNAELFPTELRSSGMSFCLTCGRLGSIVSMIASGYLVSTHLMWMLLLIAINLLSSTCCALFLRESGNCQLRDFASEPAPTPAPTEREFLSVSRAWYFKPEEN